MMHRVTLSPMVAILSLFLLAGTVWAQQPAIKVDLIVNPYTPQGQPLPAVVTVTNQDGNNLLMNGGFGAGLTQFKIQVIDPAGRRILPAVAAPGESADSGPLPIVDYNGREIQAASCEWLARGAVLSSPNVDLRTIYSMTLPGYYSAQVHIDAAVFNSLPCSVNDYRWQGVLYSETKYFFYEGNTPIALGLTNWPLAWADGSYKDDLLAVTLSPPAPMNNYDLKSFRLNGIATRGDAVISGSTMIAYFSKKEAFDTLSNPIVGQGYPVSVTGLTNTGVVFGGARQVKIVSPYTFNGFISPVDNLPTINTARAGQTVPVKWQLSGGVSVPSTSDASSFKALTSSLVNCDTSAPLESPIEQYATGTSGLQNLGGGNWQYNWATPKSYAGTCRKMVLILNDGTSHEAKFKFR